MGRQQGQGWNVRLELPLASQSHAHRGRPNSPRANPTSSDNRCRFFDLLAPGLRQRATENPRVGGSIPPLATIHASVHRTTYVPDIRRGRGGGWAAISSLPMCPSAPTEPSDALIGIPN